MGSALERFLQVSCHTHYLELKKSVEMNTWKCFLSFYLQELVSDAQLGHTQPVFQFLCPIVQLLSSKDHKGGVWSFLNGLASFLNPGQDEDEVKTDFGQ